MADRPVQIEMIKVTPAMVEQGVFALLEWLADGRTDQTSLLAVELGVQEVLNSVFGRSISFVDEGGNIIREPDGALTNAIYSGQIK